MGVRLDRAVKIGRTLVECIQDAPLEQPCRTACARGRTGATMCPFVKLPPRDKDTDKPQYHTERLERWLEE